MADPIELLIQGRAHELGPGFAVRRVLPSAKRRMVGPFIFLDHFIRISGSPPSPICSTAASSIATAWAMRRRSARAT